jgi:hypothetical protein
VAKTWASDSWIGDGEAMISGNGSIPDNELDICDAMILVAGRVRK